MYFLSKDDVIQNLNKICESDDLDLPSSNSTKYPPEN